jgi:hypothetical protein
MAAKSATKTKPKKQASASAMPRPGTPIDPISGIMTPFGSARNRALLTKWQKLPKPRSQDHRAYWKKNMELDDVARSQGRTHDYALHTPQGQADFHFAFAASKLDFVNVIPGKEDAPEFHLIGEKETPADRAAFEQFLDRHFPRSDERCARLRSGLDFRDPKLMLPIQVNRPMTAIEVYNFLVRDRKHLRSSSIDAHYWAKQAGAPRPPLRICDCGLLFLAARPNVKWHSKTCGSRVRMARARVLGKAAEYEAKSEGKKAEKERKQKLKAKGAPK